MEWTDERCLDLIQQYQEYDLLWQARHPQHFNKIKKQDAWVAISTQMLVDAEECKKKINSLLSSFRRENTKSKKSQRTGSGRDEIYVSSWFAFRAMQFLQDKDEPRARLNTLLENDSSEERESQVWLDTEEMGNETPPPIAENLNRMPPPSKPPARKSRKLISNDRLDQAFSMLQSTSSVASSLSRNEETEHDIFGKLVAKKLKKYSPDLSSIAQEEIMKILFKADRGCLNVNNQRLPLIQYTSQSLHHSNPNTFYQPQPCHSTPYSNSSQLNPQNPNIPLSVAVATGETSPTATTPGPRSSPVQQFYSIFDPNTSNSIDEDDNSDNYEEI